MLQLATTQLNSLSTYSRWLGAFGKGPRTVPGPELGLDIVWEVLAGTGHSVPGTVPPVKLYRPLTRQCLNPFPALLHVSSVTIEVV